MADEKTRRHYKRTKKLDAGHWHHLSNTVPRAEREDVRQTLFLVILCLTDCVSTPVVGNFLSIGAGGAFLAGAPVPLLLKEMRMGVAHNLREPPVVGQMESRALAGNSFGLHSEDREEQLLMDVVAQRQAVLSIWSRTP